MTKENGLEKKTQRNRHRGAHAQDNADQPIEKQVNAACACRDVNRRRHKEGSAQDGNPWNLLFGQMTAAKPGQEAREKEADDEPRPLENTIGDM